MLLIKVNGKESEVSNDISIYKLVKDRKLPLAAVIAELNGTVVVRELWDNTRLSPGDVLEVISIIGGG